MISVSSKFIKYCTDSLLLWFLILLLLVQYKSIRSGSNIVKKTIRDKNKKRQTSCDVKGRRPTLIQLPVWPLGGTLTSPMYTMAIMVAFTLTRSYPFYLQYLSIYLSYSFIQKDKTNSGVLDMLQNRSGEALRHPTIPCCCPLLILWWQ